MTAIEFATTRTLTIEPTWLVTVQRWGAHGERTLAQIDAIDAHGVNSGSLSPASLAARGYVLPSCLWPVVTLPQGKWRVADLPTA